MDAKLPVLQKIRCTVCKTFMCDVVGFQIDPAIEFKSINVHWSMLCPNRTCPSRKSKEAVIVSVEFVMPEQKNGKKSRDGASAAPE